MAHAIKLLVVAAGLLVEMRDLQHVPSGPGRGQSDLTFVVGDQRLLPLGGTDDGHLGFRQRRAAEHEHQDITVRRRRHELQVELGGGFAATRLGVIDRLW